MDENPGSIRNSDKVVSKRPGPRLSACQWCGKVTCNHCRCSGQSNCSHAPGEMCKNQRYKRRLVCNPCEKNKLKNRQMFQQTQEKKFEQSALVQAPYSGSVLTAMDQSRLKRESGFTGTTQMQSPNVAIIFYKTQQVLTMIPVSALQSSVAQLRDVITGMKLFIGDTKFIFVQENMIISLEDEKKISAASIIREYSFPYPINCNRCIFIHIRPQVVDCFHLDDKQMMSMPMIQQLPGMWSSSSYPSVSASSFPQSSSGFSQPGTTQAPVVGGKTPKTTVPSDKQGTDSIPDSSSQSTLPPSKVATMVASTDSSSSDLPKGKEYARLSHDSGQWTLLPNSEILMNQTPNAPFSMDMRSSYSQGFVHSDGHGAMNFQEEGLTSDFFRGLSPGPRSTSYGDMSFMIPFHSNPIIRRSSDNSDYSWPVFTKRPGIPMETDESTFYTNEYVHPIEISDHQRGSTLSAEEVQLSNVLSGLKRDRGVHSLVQDAKESSEPTVETAPFVPTKSEEPNLASSDNKSPLVSDSLVL